MLVQKVRTDPFCIPNRILTGLTSQVLAEQASLAQMLKNLDLTPELLITDYCEALLRALWPEPVDRALISSSAVDGCTVEVTRCISHHPVIREGPIWRAMEAMGHTLGPSPVSAWN